MKTKSVLLFVVCCLSFISCGGSSGVKKSDKNIAAGLEGGACLAGSTCSSADLSCVNNICTKVQVACTADTECTAPQTCVNGFCATPVAADCNPPMHMCSSGYECVDGKCVASTNSSCTKDEECGEGKKCDNGACTDAGQCTKDTECTGEHQNCLNGKCETVFSIVYNVPAGIDNVVAAVTSDKGYVVAGQSESYLVVAKINSSGSEVEWQKKLDSTEDPARYPRSIITDGKNILLAGVFDGSNSDDFFIIKLNEKGEILKQKKYQIDLSGLSINFDLSLIKSGDSYFIVTSGSIIKLNEELEIVKSYYYTTDNFPNYYTNAYPTKDGGLIAVGGNSLNQGSLLISKLKSDLSTDWFKIFRGSNSYDWAMAVRENPDGSYIISGLSSNSDGFDPGITLKIKSDGELLWQKSYTFNNDTALTTANEMNDAYLFSGDYVWASTRFLIKVSKDDTTLKGIKTYKYGPRIMLEASSGEFTMVGRYGFYKIWILKPYPNLALPSYLSSCAVTYNPSLETQLKSDYKLEDVTADSGGVTSQEATIEILDSKFTSTGLNNKIQTNTCK